MSDAVRDAVNGSSPTEVDVSTHLSSSNPWRPRVRSALARFSGLLGSFPVAVTLLLLLLTLTLLGTLAQRSESLYDVQRRYFHSLWVVIDMGPVSIPLPGGALALSLFCVNLVIGGVVRLRRGASTVGILVAHLGILLLFGGGLLEVLASDKGQMTVYESAGGASADPESTSDRFESLYEWELSVAERRSDGSLVEHVIPGDRLELAAEGTLRATSAGLPFDVVVSQFARNGRPLPRSARGGASAWTIETLDAAREAERNIPAARVTFDSRGAPRGVEAPSAIVWGAQRLPWSTTVGGVPYEVDLRRRSWPLPFALRLDRFVHEMHPGTQIDRRFSSYVTKLEGETEQSVHITMNEPLRHGGYTFYQSGWGPKEGAPGTRRFSTFSVVRNPSDRLPILACVVIAAGLLIHFGRRLLRHVAAESRRRDETTAPPTVLPDAPEPRTPGRRRPVRVAIAAVATVVLLAAGAFAWAREPAPSTWTHATVDAAAAVPLQEGGRVKPLQSYASVSLLRMSHRRTCTDDAGNSLSPIEWLLDVFLRPEKARRYRCILVEDAQVLEAAGLPHVAGRDRRDRYSFEELAPCRDRLAALARQHIRVDSKDRDSVANGIVDLYGAIELFDALSRFLDFTREIPLPASPRIRALWPGRDSVLPREVAAKSAELGPISPALDPHAGIPGAPTLRAPARGDVAAGDIREAAIAALSAANRLLIVPPASPESPSWTSPGEVIVLAATRSGAAGPQDELVERWASMSRQSEDPAAVEREMTAIREASSALARSRGEYDAIPLELTLGRLNPFSRSIVLYLLAFVALALSWAVPSRWLRGSAWTMLLLGVALHATGIVLRSVIRGRPPISTLYDTTLFIAWTGVVGLLVVERMHRRGIALAMAPVLGALLLFVGQQFETLKAEDSLPQLQAVLDTNFWLWLHVTCITLGYGGGLLASAVAHVHVLGRATGFRSHDREYYAQLSRMTYGMLGFGLFFSVVGTILGGIWANESWGRFWGWDPKENGALMICLGELAIFHSRLGGLLRPFGVAVASIANGGVVAFSWWGVNLLGIGLHSYGFTGGIMKGLTIFYAVEAVVLGVAAATHLLGRSDGGSGVGAPIVSAKSDEGRSPFAAS